MAAGVFGRDAELQIVERFLDRVRSEPTALQFEGGAGIGKTALWRAATESGCARSYCVLSCRPAESDAKLSLAALADLLREVAGDVVAGLPRPQRRALDVALLRRDSRSPRLDPRALGTGVRNVLCELARCTPVVVAVDDVQWLDAASARVLDFALRRLGDAPVGFLGTRRVGSESAETIRLERTFAEERVVRVRLGPLSVGALHNVVVDKLGAALPRPVLARVVQGSEGNPFFALEIARVLLAEGFPRPGEPLPVPVDVRQLVARRINALPPRTREALLIAAALPDASESAVAAAFGGPPGLALEPAERAAIVELDREVVRFTHPLFAAAIYAAAPLEERRRAHRRLAETAEDPEQEARHLALAADGPDERIAAALERAARAVGRRGVVTAAAELAEHALDMTEPSSAAPRRRRTMLAADFHFHAGDLAVARALLEEVVAEALPGSVRARALLRLGEVRYHEESFAEAFQVFHEAAEAVAVARNERLAVLIDIQLAYSCVNSGDFDGAGPYAERALERVEAVGPDAVIAEALAASAMVDFLRGRGLDEAKLARALALEDRDREVITAMRPALIAGSLMMYLGRIAESRALLIGVRERIVEQGQERDLPFVDAQLVWLECWSGDLDAAGAYAREAREAAARLASPSLLTVAISYGALPAALKGDVPAVRNAVAEVTALVDQTGYALTSLWALSAAALIELSLGNPSGADRALAPLVGVVESVGVREPITCFFLADDIEALVALGELERSERLLTMLEACAGRLDRIWALAAAGRCRGLLLAARGDGEQALEALAGALAQHARVDMPLELARTLVARGTIERRLRRKSAAHASLQQALDLFERAGAALWAERAREEITRVGLRPRAPGGLTASERRVAELAAGGLRNSEIASAAFISQKTVEANLARVYRKLGIRSRAELGLALRERPASRM